LQYEVRVPCFDHKAFVNSLRPLKILIAILHLDVFFLLGYWVQMLCLALALDHGIGRTVVPLTYVGLSLMPLALLLLAYETRMESVLGICMALTLMVAEVGTLLCNLALSFGSRKLVAVLTEWPNLIETYSGYGFAAATLLVATIALATCCWHNFDRGLKPFLQHGSLPVGELIGEQAPHQQPCSQMESLLSTRMEVD